MPRSPYHLGFSTLDRETRIDELPVRGAIPAWLTGTLVRTAPSKFELGEQSYNHWFDGLAMLHKFGFSEGRVSYANRYLRGRSYSEALEKGKISRSEFATDPCRSLFERVAAFFSSRTTDNCNVSINKLADEVIAFTEGPLPIRFDPDTLETLGVYDYDGSIDGQVSIAHPHFDFERGCHYSYVLECGRKSAYHLYRVDARTGRRTVVGTIPVEEPAYMHSFGMTQHYLILTEFPLVVNPLKLRFSVLTGKPFIKNYEWKPERGIAFHVVDKETGRLVKTARSATYFGFHHVNAFEEGDAVLVDIVAYPDPTVIDQLYLDRLRSSEPSTATAKLTRFRVDLGSDQDVPHERLSEIPIELPRIDYRRHAGRPYRYVFAAGSAANGDFFDKLVKLDLQAGAAAYWYEEGCYPGEPVFVAAPDGREEDAGVILSVVLDARKKASFLLILNASSFEELARAEVPHHIPFGFHGNYLAEASGAQSFRDIHR